MVNKRFITRDDWSRVLERDFNMVYIDDGQYAGHAGLLKIKKIRDPLWTTHVGKTFCIADVGYSWLLHLPDGEHFGITTMFNEKDEIVQWYIDITTHNGIENGIPYMEDLYLNLIVLPSGEIIKKDLDDMKTALYNGDITEEMYEFGFTQFYKVYEELKNGTFKYLDFSIPHKKILEKDM